MPSPPSQERALRCRIYRGGRGILTPFPFSRLLSEPGLGSTNPRLIFIAWDTFPLSADGILTRLILTTAGIFIPNGSRLPFRNPSRPSGRPPTSRWHLPADRGLGGWLRPVRFRSLPPRRVSCYTLLR